MSQFLPPEQRINTGIMLGGPMHGRQLPFPAPAGQTRVEVKVPFTKHDPLGRWTAATYRAERFCAKDQTGARREWVIWVYDEMSFVDAMGKFVELAWASTSK